MTVGIGIYSGGNPYVGTKPYKGSEAEKLFTLIAGAKYTTVVIWAAHVDTSGDIKINDSPVIVNGSFQSAAEAWADQVAGLKLAKGTTITRLELSIGGDSTSFANIKALMAQYGNGPTNPLYKGLSILQSKLGLDAVNYNDETEYDPKSSELLAGMCVALKMKVSICADGNQDYWVKLITDINNTNPETVDAVYIETYAGINPIDWNTYMKPARLTVAPGFWACHYEAPDSKVCTAETNAATVETQIAAWKQQTPLDGGWMFCGTDMLHCPSGGTVAEYANAIGEGLGNTN